MMKLARSPGSSREGCVGACFASTLCLHRPLFFPTLFFGLSLFLHRPFPCIDPLLIRPLYRFDPPLAQPLFASTFFCFDSLLYRPLFLCIAPFLCRKYRKWRPVEPGYYEQKVSNLLRKKVVGSKKKQNPFLAPVLLRNRSFSRLKMGLSQKLALPPRLSVS